VACDAIARLYDVDEDSMVFKKLQKTEDYDQGTLTFRARKGKLIDLDKLHESVWATRLSGGTNSGLVSLDVTAVGRVVTSQGALFLKVSGSDGEFVLGPHPDERYAAALATLRQAAGTSGKEFRVTGRLDNYVGRWPEVLRRLPAKPRRMLVTEFEIVESVAE
jgi:hypothetical protein